MKNHQVWWYFYPNIQNYFLLLLLQNKIKKARAMAENEHIINGVPVVAIIAKNFKTFMAAKKYIPQSQDDDFYYIYENIKHFEWEEKQEL
jgi:hypothetical protein